MLVFATDRCTDAGEMSHDIQLDAEVIKHDPAGDLSRVVAACLEEIPHRGGCWTLKLSRLPHRLKWWEMTFGPEEELTEFHRELFGRSFVMTGRQNSACLAEEVAKWGGRQFTQQDCIDFPQPQAGE